MFKIKLSMRVHATERLRDMVLTLTERAMRFIAVASAALIGLGCGIHASEVAASNAKHKTKQNVILLMSDDLGDASFALSNPTTDDPSYPNAAPLPNLASLARKGVRFKKAWSGPACTTTRGMRTTGLYPSTSGIGFALGSSVPVPGLPGISPRQALNDTELFPRVQMGKTPPIMIEPEAPQAHAPYQLLQKLARDHGYLTGKFGKAHETSFDQSEVTGPGIDAGVADIVTSGFDVFYGNMFGFPVEGFGGTRIWNPHTNIVGEGPTTEFLGSAIVSRAIRFIKHAKAKGKHYLMQVDFVEPHWIGGPRRQYEVAPGPGEPCPMDFEASGHFTCAKDWYPYLLNEQEHGDVIQQVKDAFGGTYPPAGTRSGPIGPDGLAQHIAAFKSKVSYHDQQVGRLMKHVNHKKTTTIYMGDNGTQGGNGNVTEAPSDPTRAKSTLYRGGVEVPALAWGRGVLGNPIPWSKKGRVSNAMITSSDLYATTLSLLGIKQPKATKKSSYDFSKVLLGFPNSNRPFLYSELYFATAMMQGGVARPVNNPNGGAVVGDAKGFRLLIRAKVNPRAPNGDGNFVCQAGTTPDKDCYDSASKTYRKVYNLELYDTKNDPGEESPILQAGLTGKVKKAFRRLCNHANKIAKKAVFHQNGKVCLLDGSQLMDPNAPVPTTVAQASSP